MPRSRAAVKLDRTFGALGDPTRRAILARLATRELDVASLARPFGLAPATISKHLKVLESAGLISRRREGRQLFARLEADALDASLGWMSSVRQLWNERFATIEAILSSGVNRRVSR